MNAAATVGAIGAILLATAVRAGGANNYQALALSALVAPHSPNVSVGDKKLLSLYLNGHPHAPHTRAMLSPSPPTRLPAGRAMSI